MNCNKRHIYRRETRSQGTKTPVYIYIYICEIKSEKAVLGTFLRQSSGSTHTTEVVANCVNIERFRQFLHIICLLNICTNNFAAGSCLSWKRHSTVLSFESEQRQFFHLFVFSTTNEGMVVKLWGPILVSLGNPHTISR